MDNTNARGLTAFFRIIRAFAEGSVVAFGFAFAILAIGTPIVLIIRGLYEGLSWLALFVGGPSAFVDALVSASSVAGGVILTAVFIKLFVKFFHDLDPPAIAYAGSEPLSLAHRLQHRLK